MAELIKIYWRDIPSQVTAKKGRKTAKVALGSRFQEGIDRAAMRAGKGTSDAYMEDELEAAFSDEHLEAVVKAKGIEADAKPT